MPRTQRRGDRTLPHSPKHPQLFQHPRPPDQDRSTPIDGASPVPPRDPLTRWRLRLRGTVEAVRKEQQELFAGPPGADLDPAQWTAAVRVAPARPLGTREVLTYALEAALDDAPIGQRVTVPLGRTSAQGTITAHLDPAEAQAELGSIPLKPVAGIAPTRVPAPVLELATWVSAYYHAPLGPTIASLIPAAVRAATGLKTVTLLEPAAQLSTLDAGGLPPALRGALEALRAAAKDQIWPVKPDDLRDALGLKTKRQINRLVELGVLQTVKRDRVTTRTQAPDLASGPAEPPPALTDDQRGAVEAIAGCLGGFRGVLLEGVTGSGKTEVYLHALERALARGESAIVLVPEISLTPQTAARFTGRFPGAGVVVMHSAMTGSQRHAAWRALHEGAARVALGPRSAVFAPLPHEGEGRLGLIIVDEEHDGSYKQDNSPRYHARDVALKRGQAAGCPVVLGSATPSLESFHNAGLTDPASARFLHLRLPNRVGGGKLPPVRVVDLMDERRVARQLARREGRADTNPLLGPTLTAAIRDKLTAEGPTPGQAILLLNRRGYAGYVASANPETSWVLMCKHCDVNLVVHRLPAPGETDRYAKCHHCGAMTLVPDLCPEDGSKLVLLNFGTQRLEEELRPQLADILEPDQIARVDADTMRSAHDYHGTLDRFRRGEARLLLGTQMIAKGLDFPNVRLIGVVNADTALALPDFRATERTAQLIAQVAGRAGRAAGSADRSLVIVQTASPHNPAVRAAAAHDYRSFASEELSLRAQAHLPPVSRLARLVFRETDFARANERAGHAAAALREAGIEGLSLRGPATAPIARINDRYRVELVLIAPSVTPVQTALALLRNRDLVTADASCVVDVDPVALT